MARKNGDGQHMMAPAYQVRPMTPADIPYVMQIEQAVFQGAWQSTTFLAEIKDNPLSHYLVLANDDDLPIGYGGIWVILDEAHLTKIATNPYHQRQGLGSQLLAGLIALCSLAKVRFLTLEVRLSNRSAQDFYLHHGFLAEGVRPGYYDDGEDACIMTKYFSGEDDVCKTM